MEVMQIAQEIRAKIVHSTIARNSLKEAGRNRALAYATYERELAKTIIGLKNGKEYELDGETIINPPTTITEKIAKGLCWKVALKRDEAEATYRYAIESIRVSLAQLSAHQSLNKYLDEM